MTTTTTTATRKTEAQLWSDEVNMLLAAFPNADIELLMDMADARAQLAFDVQDVA